MAKSKLVKFLNSPFGLWMLSTIVVGSVTFIYQQASKRREILSETAWKTFLISNENKFRNSIVNNALREYDFTLKESISLLNKSKKLTIAEAYSLSESAVKIPAAIILVGIYNEPYRRNEGGDQVLKTVNITPEWQIGLTHFNLDNGFLQKEFEHFSEFENEVQLAILEGKISPSEVIEKTSGFEEIKNNLTNSIKLNRTLSDSLETIKHLQLYKPNKFYDKSSLVTNPEKFIKDIDNWINHIKSNWTRFRDYNWDEKRCFE